MEEIVVIKGPNNSLYPATDEDAGKISKYKLGQGVKLKSTKMSEHNYRFHKKTIMLFHLCYERFSESITGGQEYKGQLIKPSFDMFREELTILAGHYEAHYSMNGTFRLRGKSLAYHNTTDDEKEKIYSSVINAALKHVYNGNMPEDELRRTVEELLQFDR